ncbi:hypothetical protein XBKQ1_970020 [Xenorhabdus bovienii str. kraussei Quebec]|uniref:Uncharacterized protein n=1 Tax=Xenorhabdus bovienii str. kraussei Quebec TaxID=1398203 RepID=A0A077PQN9_XENBV|nr:hypothetical protein XBKQ1_970020 [Xenorhabdus bovienii str. kraussei Quebec]
MEIFRVNPGVYAKTIEIEDGNYRLRFISRNKYTITPTISTLGDTGISGTLESSTDKKLIEPPIT